MVGRMETFQYEPLEQSRSIRLLDVLSYNSDNPEISCKIQVMGLDEHACTPYIALSYTWKLPEIEENNPVARCSPPTIRIDGKTLEVGQNLYDCLKQLLDLYHDAYSTNDMHSEEDTHSTNHALMWIDAICINQKDIAETSNQVAMMQEIYSRAEGVMVWLGREDCHSSKALALIKKLSESDSAEAFLETNRNAFMRTPHPEGDKEFYLRSSIDPLSQKDWTSIEKFFSRSWFHRLWCVQELVIGQDRNMVTLLCEDKVVEWDQLAEFIMTIWTRGWHHMITMKRRQSSSTNQTGVLGVDVALAMGAVYKAERTPTPPPDSIATLLERVFSYHDQNSFLCAKLAWMLHLGRQKQVTDQRDRIFALSGMISQYLIPDEWRLLRPNYSKSLERVFADVTKFMLLSMANLSVLSFVEDKSFRVHSRLPSWVPDFSADPKPLPLVVYSSCDVRSNETRSDPQRLVSDGDSLCLRGCRFDTITSVSAALAKAQLFHNFSHLITMVASTSTYSSSNGWLSAFMKTLAAGTTRDVVSREPGRPPDAFDSLQGSFIEFLKYEIAFEIWEWLSPQKLATEDWWTANSDFGSLCDDAANTLPTSSEFKEYFTTFRRLYSAQQDARENPIIEDEDFVKTIWNPSLPYRTRILIPCAFRRLLITKEGSMGLCPLSAKDGDEIWFLEGAPVPSVLRKRPGGDGYGFLGEAYVQGVMHGELLRQEGYSQFQSVILK